MQQESRNTLVLKKEVGRKIQKVGGINQDQVI